MHIYFFNYKELLHSYENKTAFCRMRAVRYQPYAFRWPPVDVSNGPQVNEFEQVSSDDHQISVAEVEGWYVVDAQVVNLTVLLV